MWPSMEWYNRRIECHLAGVLKMLSRHNLACPRRTPTTRSRLSTTLTRSQVRSSSSRWAVTASTWTRSTAFRSSRARTSGTCAGALWISSSSKSTKSTSVSRHRGAAASPSARTWIRPWQLHPQARVESTWRSSRSRGRAYLRALASSRLRRCSTGVSYRIWGALAEGIYLRSQGMTSSTTAMQLLSIQAACSRSTKITLNRPRSSPCSTPTSAIRALKCSTHSRSRWMIRWTCRRRLACSPSWAVPISPTHRNSL